MGANRFYDVSQTITLEQHRRLAAQTDRPLTDRPVGAYTDGRRSNDAFCSALFDDPSAARTGSKVAVTKLGKDGVDKTATGTGRATPKPKTPRIGRSLPLSRERRPRSATHRPRTRRTNVSPTTADLAADLRRRGHACLELAATFPLGSGQRSRLCAKAGAYLHAAELTEESK